MTKLKTLKDIDWDEPHLMVEELRQEAIKWIKHNMNRDKIIEFDRGAIDIMRVFFNITEGDLE